MKSPDHPLVSVAMCTYNGDKYLQSQLDSIINQSYTNLEIIIVDDGSTDETMKIIQFNAEKEGRIKFYANDHNLGYNKNFEKAFGLCTAEYIAISDQDDVWELNKIETMMSNWHNESSFIYSLSGSFNGEEFSKRKPAPNVLYKQITDVHHLVFNSPVHGHACIFKKELLSKCTPFPKDIFYDWWMSMHAALIGNIGCIPQTLTWHRIHPKNSSRDLTSIKNNAEKTALLRKQSIYFIETFCSKKLLTENQKTSLLKYVSLLKKMDGNKFNKEMFWYVYTNRKLIFHYKKKKLFLFFSYSKHACRMARTGIM